MTFGADLIVGFPTEDQIQFKNTTECVEECGFTNIHIFPFSPKEGTPASKMPQVSNIDKNKRVSDLRELGAKIKLNKMKQKIGKKINVLFESLKLSYTDDYFKLRINPNFSCNIAKGQLIKVKVLRIDNDYLIGEIVE